MAALGFWVYIPVAIIIYMDPLPGGPIGFFAAGHYSLLWILTYTKLAQDIFKFQLVETIILISASLVCTFCYLLDYWRDNTLVNNKK